MRMEKKKLVCECGAEVPDASRYRRRFLSRHPLSRPEEMPGHLAQVKSRKEREAREAEQRKGAGR